MTRVCGTDLMGVVRIHPRYRRDMAVDQFDR